MKTTPKKNGGFTLVELIVVIAILAILAAVAIPAYSGYIEKAEEANDLQLLGALNVAYNSACVENNIFDMSTMEGAEFLLDGTEGAMSISGLKLPGGYTATVSEATFSNDLATAIYNSFALYFGDNLQTPFKVFIQIVYTEEGFVGYGKDDCTIVPLPNGGTITLTPKQLEVLKESVLTKDAETVETLMNQVDGVSTLVSGLLDSSPGLAATVLGDYITQDDYLANSIKALGGTVDTSGEKTLWDQYTDMVDQFKTEQAAQKMADELGIDIKDFDPLKLTDDQFDRYNQIESEVGNQVNKNLLIMSVAQNAATQDKTGVMNIINSTDPKQGLIDAMSGTSGADGMGQAALVYGAFTAYAMSDDASSAAKQALAESSKEGGDPTAVFDILKGEELTKFQAYMADQNKGQKDLDACIEAMGVIDNTSKDQDAVSGLMANGFNNNDFVGALNDLLGNS